MSNHTDISEGLFSFPSLGSQTNSQLEIIRADSFILTTSPTEFVQAEFTPAGVGPLELW